MFFARNIFFYICGFELLFACWACTYLASLPFICSVWSVNYFVMYPQLVFSFLPNFSWLLPIIHLIQEPVLILLSRPHILAALSHFHFFLQSLLLYIYIYICLLLFYCYTLNLLYSHFNAVSGRRGCKCSASDHLDDLEQDIQLIWASNFPSIKRKGVQVFDLN